MLNNITFNISPMFSLGPVSSSERRIANVVKYKTVKGLVLVGPKPECKTQGWCATYQDGEFALYIEEAKDVWLSLKNDKFLGDAVYRKADRISDKNEGVPLVRILREFCIEW